MAIVQREKGLKTFLVLEKGKEVHIPVDNVHNRFGVDGVIRITALEWESFPKGNTLTHFNLQYCGHKVGHKYMLCKIERHGSFTEQKEVPPLLMFENARIGMCTSVQEETNYEQLFNESFGDSFTNIQNIEQLKKAILRRYKRSMPQLSDEEILRLGVSVTKLRFIS